MLRIREAPGSRQNAALHVVILQLPECARNLNVTIDISLPCVHISASFNAEARGGYGARLGASPEKARRCRYGPDKWHSGSGWIGASVVMGTLPMATAVECRLRGGQMDILARLNRRL